MSPRDQRRLNRLAFAMELVCITCVVAGLLVMFGIVVFEAPTWVLG